MVDYGFDGLSLWDFNGDTKTTEDEVYEPDEFAADTANCSACRMFVIMDQCHSGQFTPIAADGNHGMMAIYTAAAADQSSYRRQYMARWETLDPSTMTINEMHQDVIDNGNLDVNSTPQSAEGTAGNGDMSLCECCNIGCSVYAYWSSVGGPDEWECNYEACASGQCGPIQTATSLTINGNTVTVILGNYHVPENKKDVYIRVEGTGATGQPGNHDLDPAGTYTFETAPPVGGVWYIEVEATIIPQPDEVVLTFEVPGTPDLSQAWASESCTPWGGIPTVSEWGLMVLTLLVLTAGTVVLGRRWPAAA